MKDERVELIPADRIKVPERFRKDLGDIEELAESLKARGQIQPIVVDHNNHLIVGHRRLEACKALGVPVRVLRASKLSPREKMLVELEENTKRKSMTHVEEIEAMEKIHELLGEQRKEGGDGEQSIRDTAEYLGVSHGTVHRKLELAEAMKILPGLRNTKDESEMYTLFRRAREEALVEELDRRRQDTSSQVEGTGEIICADVVEYLKGFAEGEFPANLIVVDPPYGIELGKKKKAEVDYTMKDAIYDDSEEEWRSLITRFLNELSRVAPQSAHLFIFHGYEWWLIQYLQNALYETGWDYDECPYIWAKVSYPGQTQRPDFNAGRCWEPFTFAYRGPVPLAKKGASNILLYQPLLPAKKTHPVEKPVELLEDIIGRSAEGRPNTMVFDGFCGSGSTLRAAKRLGLRYIGVDIDEYNVKVAKVNLSQEVNIGGGTK